MLVILLGQIDLSLPWVVSVGAMMSSAVAGFGDVGKGSPALRGQDFRSEAPKNPPAELKVTARLLSPAG